MQAKRPSAASARWLLVVAVVGVAMLLVGLVSAGAFGIGGSCSSPSRQQQRRDPGSHAR